MPIYIFSLPSLPKDKEYKDINGLQLETTCPNSLWGLSGLFAQRVMTAQSCADISQGKYIRTPFGAR